MSARISLQERVDDYLAERRRLGYQLHSQDTLLAGFARYVASRHHRGPLTVELMADWARQDKWNRGTPGTWAVRLALLRRFARYLKQFEPDTEVPDESIFGRKPGRLTPHIYREDEIVELLAVARKIGPRGSVRPATFEGSFQYFRKSNTSGCNLGLVRAPAPPLFWTIVEKHAFALMRPTSARLSPAQFDTARRCWQTGNTRTC